MRAFVLTVALVASCRDFGFIVSSQDAGPEAGVDAQPDAEIEAGLSCPEACAPASYCNRERGACEACPPLGDNPSEIYVDAAFTSGTGTKECPLASLAEGMTKATASQAAGKTVRIAKGTYAADTRAFVVRGFSVIGAGRGLTVIEGVGSDVRDTVNGSRPSPTPADRYRSVFVVGHPTAVTRISGMTLRTKDPGLIRLTIPILCDQGNAAAMLATPEDPNTFLSDLEIVGPYETGIAVASWTKGFTSACNARITGSQLTGGRTGVAAYGCYSTVSGADVAVELGDGTEAGKNVFEKPDMAGGNDRGVLVTECVSSALVKNNVFRDGTVGLYLHQPLRVPNGVFERGRYEIRSNRFEKLTAFGAQIHGSAVHVLTDNVFEGIRAPQAATAPAIALELRNPTNGNNHFPHPMPGRGNRFIGNDVAILVKASYGLSFEAGRPYFDFGTASEPGNNVFRCNSALAGSLYTGGDIVLDSAIDALLPFRGNRWDHAPATNLHADTTGYDAVINGADVRRVTSPGANADTADATVATEPCPAGATAGP